MWKCELCGKSDTPEDKICKIPGSNNKFALGECIICKKWTPFNFINKITDAIK